MPPSQLHIFQDKKLIEDFLIQHWQESAKEAIRKRGRFVVAVSGGRTPIDFFEQLSRATFKFWPHTHIFQVDERYVPLTHHDNNFGMLNKTLLSKIPGLSNRAYPFICEGKSIEHDCQLYEERLKAFFKLKRDQGPCFDLIMLGIGQDGHTASLFPRGQELKEKKRLVVISQSENHPHARLSLTLPVINHGRKVIFYVMGEKNASIMRRIFKRKNLPAHYVKPAKGQLIFCLDQEAASKLNSL